MIDKMVTNYFITEKPQMHLGQRLYFPSLLLGSRHGLVLRKCVVLWLKECYQEFDYLQTLDSLLPFQVLFYRDKFLLLVSLLQA